MLGMPKDTLRYYDRIGVLSPSREENGYRKYSRDDLVELMNIQIMQYADFTLDEIRGKLQLRKLNPLDRAQGEVMANFMDAKYAETRRKIAHLEKVSELLAATAGALRDLKPGSDQRLKEMVRALYRDIRGNQTVIMEEDCHAEED